MGLFKFIKSVREEIKKHDNYLKIGVEELKNLSDEDLKEAVSERMLAEENGWEVSECLQKFKGAKRIYYIVNYFDMEVQNGGLCQFFVNSSREVAPYILECLQRIGAENYEVLLRDFIEKYAIHLKELDSFVIEEVEDYEAQTERYPFDEFDDAYYALYEKEPLEDILLTFVKQNFNEFEMNKKQ